MTRRNRIRLARLALPLAVGMGFALVLLIALTPSAPAEAQVPASDSTGQAADHLSVLSESSRKQGNAVSEQPTTQAAVRLSGSAGVQSVYPGFTVDLFQNSIWGKVEPGQVVTITSPGDVYGAAVADATGFFWSPLWDGSTGTQADVALGDALSLYVDGALHSTITPQAINGAVDPVSDLVSGHVVGDSGGTAVTVTIKGSQVAGTTDSSGDFGIDFSIVLDLDASDWADVDVGSGAYVRTRLFPTGHLIVNSYNTLEGYVQPGQILTATVYTGTATVKTTLGMTASGRDGWYSVQPGVSLDPGDLVEVDVGAGTVISTVVADLSLEVNASTGMVSGSAPVDESVTAAFWRWAGNAQRYFWDNIQATGGAYGIQFDALVDWPGPWVHAIVADANGNETWLFGGAPHIDVHADWDNAWARADAGGVPVTATLDTGSEAFTWNGESHPIYRGVWGVWFDDGTGEPVDIEAGHIITVESPTRADSVTVSQVELGFDVAANQVFGDAGSGEAIVIAYQQQHGRYPVNGSSGQTATVSSPFTATLSDFDLRYGGSVEVAHCAAGGFCTRFSRDLPSVYVERPHGVGGSAWMPDEALTATLFFSDGVSIKHRTSDDHDDDPLRFWFGDWAGNGFAPGDWLTVTGASGWAAGARLVDLTVNVDAANDQMVGRGPVGLLEVHWDNHPGDDGRDEWLPTDSGGGYIIGWRAYGVDVQRGHNLRPYSAMPSGVWIGQNFRWPETRVNYGHDWVEGYYESGHTVWITVTESDSSTVKATTQLETQIIPWWGGESGFSTDLDEQWTPWRPDILAGDWVFGRMDDGNGFDIRVGLINGELDMDADAVSGTITANWFTQTLNASCGVWEDNGPGTDFQVEPQGGAYSCDFGALGWDLQPGQDVGVEYQQPDGNWVANVFQEPAPDIRVEKWAEGGGEVIPNGPAVFTIRYQNEGAAPADVVWITDTIPENTSYVTDTSGLTPDIDGRQVSWSLGALRPNQAGQFQILLDNTATASDTLTNVVEGSAAYDFNSDNGFATAEIHVAHGQPDLYVHKNANPGHPTPGQTFLWRIEYGNQGSVASGPVALTDTIPTSTTIVSWFSEYAYGLWDDESTGAEFVLRAPTLPGHWEDAILLRLRVDEGVAVGTQLTNTVFITTAEDSDADNNLDVRDDVNVSDPDWNVGVEKHWGWGQLVPGAVIAYDVHYGNRGNMPVQTWITDVLPSGTGFVTSTRSTAVGQDPFPPAYIGADVVVWDLGVLEPGEDGNLSLELEIAPVVAPDTVITNCISVAITQTDGWPYDNSDCAVETVREAGPNLRVRKESRWLSEDRLEYSVSFENIGTTTLDDVMITDTLPVSTSYSGDWWHSFWEQIQFADNDGELVWTLSRLEPEWSASVGFNVDLDGAVVGTQGLVFTNVVQAPIVDDVFPADNVAADVATSGPDVYVVKSLGSGEPRPGNVVTFTIEFGNQNLWWGTDEGYDSRITDTLPAEMTFVRAWAPWDPQWLPAEQQGNTLAWTWGPMCSGCTWFFEVAAQITDTVTSGDEFTNTVEARGDSPNDVEAVVNNNVSVLPLTVLDPLFRVNKVFESSRVVGSFVVYTVTVTNLGNAPGSNVVLSDTVPLGLSNVSTDGAYDGKDVTWSFSSIPANGGTATGYVSARLPLTVGQTIVNNVYRVVTSDQGVGSPMGPAVSFTIQPISVFLPVVTRNY